MAETTPGGSTGLLDSLATFATTLVAIARTRLELLSSDLEEEAAHLFAFLVSALVALFCFGIGVVLATILIVVVFWDTHRLLALGVLAGCFIAAGLATWGLAMRRQKAKPKLFAASLSELAKDRHHLAPRS